MIQHGDYELTATNFAHPDITTGQHTNGPAAIWVRRKGGAWYYTGEKSMHKVRAQLDSLGDAFLERLARELPMKESQ